jgi:hypothetical protein
MTTPLSYISELILPNPSKSSSYTSIVSIQRESQYAVTSAVLFAIHISTPEHKSFLLVRSQIFETNTSIFWFSLGDDHMSNKQILNAIGPRLLDFQDPRDHVNLHSLQERGIIG